MGGRFFQEWLTIHLFDCFRDSDDVRILLIHSAWWSDDHYELDEREGASSEAQKGIECLRMVLGVACGAECGDEVSDYILWQLRCRPDSRRQKIKSPQSRSQVL